MSDDEHELVMPFVVCKTNGGNYDDDAFVAGAYLGGIQETLNRDHRYRGYVPSDLVPQLDLLAMHHRLQFTVEPWDEQPDEWTLVEMVGGRAADE